MDSLIEIVATVGYIGRIPEEAGTAMSVVESGVAYFFPEPRWIEAICFFSCAAGFAVAAPAVRVLHSKDPKAFVLDELAGMTLALLFVPLTPVSIILALLLFRFFDILKPLGIRRLDAMKHPSGIVWDDLLAGLYSNLALRLILFLIQASRAV